MPRFHPITHDRECQLNETIFKFIDYLGSLKGDRTPKLVDKTTKSEFWKSLKELSKCQSFLEGNEKYGYVTVLHRAITRFKLCSSERNEAQRKILQSQREVIQHIIRKYPELLYSNRDNSREFCGQTPLHMAISKEDKVMVTMLLDAAKSIDTTKQGRLKEHLSQKATGLRFKNNVMMGQLPLSVAALTGNKEIVKLLLNQWDTDVYQQNSTNDNLCHSILKYLKIFPDQEDRAIEMMRFINDEKEACCKKLFLMVNEDKETPLMLAAKYGQVEIFHYIIEEGYCTSDESSGLFDERLYDMTEIDHQLKESKRLEDEKEIKNDLETKANIVIPREKNMWVPSVFDLIFHHSYKTSLQFMKIRPIQWLIMKKWKYYRRFLCGFFILHLTIMSFLTWAAVDRVTNQRKVRINQGLHWPVLIIYVITIIIVLILYTYVGGFTIVQQCRKMCQCSRKPIQNPYANARFEVLFLLFAMLIISDLFVSFATDYNNMCLIIAVVIGWYLLLFFLRAHRFFCFFTSLIQRIMLPDIASFAFIIAIQLVAFSTAMFMLLHDPNNPNTDSYSSWEGMLMLTFKSFLGVADIPISESSQPVWLSIVFIIFTIMTAILMLNALIAVLSSTCTDLLTHFTPDMHLYLQQLAVILFFEEILPNRITHYFAKKVTREIDIDVYDRERDKIRTMKRHLLRIDVMDDKEGQDYETVETIIHKLTTVVYDKFTGSNRIKESNSEPIKPIRPRTNSKFTMTKAVEPLDLWKRLDIYNHQQIEQNNSI